MRRTWCLIAIGILCSFTSLRAEYFVISFYKVDVNITPEGFAEVTETITVNFSQPRHGIFRFIPYRNVVEGKTQDFFFDEFSVDEFPFQKSRENENIVLRIGDSKKYVDGKQVYTIRYKVWNPFFDLKDYSMFYWDLIGTKWPVEIGSINFEIRFPDQVYIKPDDVLVYSGTEGSTANDVKYLAFPKKVEGHTTRTFQPGEGITVAVRFPTGTFKGLSDWEMFVKKHGLLLAPVFFLIAGIAARWFARNKRETIMVEYFPPDNVSPAIAGGFVDHSVDNNDVLALIPHLANKGYLRMEIEKGGFLQKDNVIFHKLQEPGSDLMEFERTFFNGLFSSGNRVELRDLKNRFYLTMATVKTGVNSWIKNQQWYANDQKQFGCAVALMGLISILWGGYALFLRGDIDGLALILTGIFLFYLTSRFNKRSPSGNETYRRYEGFRQFIAKAERPVIEKLLKEDPLYYDKTMPYALAFGYLKKWNRQFDGLLTQPPSWYSGPMMYGGNPMASWNTFSDSFPSEINNIGSVFSSSPSSSGSGGSGGGGGFSGGGGGGGGGGSW